MTSGPGGVEKLQSARDQQVIQRSVGFWTKGMWRLHRRIHRSPTPKKIQAASKIGHEPRRELRLVRFLGNKLLKTGANSRPKWRRPTVLDYIPAQRGEGGKYSFSPVKKPQIRPSLQPQDFVTAYAGKYDSRVQSNLTIVRKIQVRIGIKNRLREWLLQIAPAAKRKGFSGMDNLARNAQFFGEARRRMLQL